MSYIEYLIVTAYEKMKKWGWNTFTHVFCVHNEIQQVIFISHHKLCEKCGKRLYGKELEQKICFLCDWKDKE